MTTTPFNEQNTVERLATLRAEAAVNPIETEVWVDTPADYDLKHYGTFADQALAELFIQQITVEGVEFKTRVAESNHVDKVIRTIEPLLVNAAWNLQEIREVVSGYLAGRPEADARSRVDAALDKLIAETDSVNNAKAEALEEAADAEMAHGGATQVVERLLARAAGYRNRIG